MNEQELLDAFGPHYELAQTKPDKKYSILPTILHHLNTNKTTNTIDLGCGLGEITTKLNGTITGIDSVPDLIETAKRLTNSSQIIYKTMDVRDEDYEPYDRICCPFVLNYLSAKDLPNLFNRFSQMKPGLLFLTLDNPKNKFSDNRKFGTIKKINDYREDAPIDVELYSNNKKITQFTSLYHSPCFVIKLLQESGFREISEENPIISKEGIKRFGKAYWTEYMSVCDLMYIKAVKQ